MCKRLNLDHTTKPESDQENETYRIFCDSEIQTNHLIPPKRLDLQIIYKKKKRKEKKKRTCIMDFVVPADCKVKIKASGKIDKYLNLARELEKNFGTCGGDTNCCWNGPQKIGIRIGRVGNQRKN